MIIYVNVTEVPLIDVMQICFFFYVAGKTREIEFGKIQLMAGILMDWVTYRQLGI